MQAITLSCCRTLRSSWAVQAYWHGLLHFKSLLHKPPPTCLLHRRPCRLLMTYFFGWSASCQWGECVLGILSAYSHGCALLSLLSSRRCWRSRNWLLWRIQLWHGQTSHIPMSKPLSWQAALAPAASAVSCFSVRKLGNHSPMSAITERDVHIHLFAFCDNLRVFFSFSTVTLSGRRKRE